MMFLEVSHSIYKTKGKNPLVIIKVDLEKVYDRLLWNIIVNVLRAFNFPEVFVS